MEGACRKGACVCVCVCVCVRGTGACVGVVWKGAAGCNSAPPGPPPPCVPHETAGSNRPPVPFPPPPQAPPPPEHRLLVQGVLLGVLFKCLVRLGLQVILPGVGWEVARMFGKAVQDGVGGWGMGIGGGVWGVGR